MTLPEDNADNSFQHRANMYWHGKIRADPWRALTIADAEQLIPLPPSNVSPRARQLYAAENLRHKDHIIAALLGFFLGMFGIHKFYLGYNQAAFIMLATTIVGGICTCGLALVVVWALGVLEGAFYLAKTQEKFEELYILNQRDWL